MTRFRKTITALAVTAAATVAFAAPASANINPDVYARGTIFVQNMSPTDTVLTNNIYTYAVNYYEGLAASNGVNWNVVAGACQVGSPCIHVMSGNWGNTGWDGMTYPAATCSGSTYCSWDGSGEKPDHTSLYWTTLKFNEYLPHTAHDWNAVGCHEFGHGLPGLQHASGSTCMQASGYTYITIQATEVIEVRNKYAGVTRVAYKPSYKVTGRNPVSYHLAGTTR